MRITTLLAAGAWMTQALYSDLGGAQGTPLAIPIPAVTIATWPTRQTPSDVIQSAGLRTLKEMESNPDAYRKDPSKLRLVVDKYLLPYFDTEYAARLVLGQYWRTANHEQRRQFQDAFYRSLLATYGSGLVGLTPDRLKVFPTTVEPSADHATVRTEVRADNADRVAMNYSMHKTLEGWKVYDVTVDGVSYIKSYREDFAAQIQQLGLDSVIARLEEGEKSAAAARPATLSGSTR